MSLAAIAMAAVTSVHAAPAPTQPIPRVEVGTHTAFIKKLSASADGRLLLSVSDDKTARLWSAVDGKLLHVLRVPIADGHEGQLYAGALSPDGSIAAVGGFTGAAESGTGTLYLLSTGSAKLYRRITQLPPYAIENVLFSQDGSILALCFADGAGVMFFDWAKGAFIRGDRSATDKILGADFAPNGDLAITTFDGKLLVYPAASRYADVQTRPLTEGRSPMHVRYSPDGSRLVVGFDDAPVVAILDARSLATTATMRLPRAGAQRGLHIVDWSSDGNFVFTGGEGLAGASSSILRWNAQPGGAVEIVLSSTERISDIRRLPDGAMAFSSGEPEIGVVERGGRTRWRLHGSALRFDARAIDLRVAANGSVVEFNIAATGARTTFDLGSPIESMVRRTQGVSAGLRSAQAAASGWQVQSESLGEALTIDSTPATLDHREQATTWTFAPGARTVLVGTTWSLRSYGRKARLLWRRPLSAQVVAVNFSSDGRLAVAALADGTIRWYRATDGAEVFSLFVHRNGIDWIGWIPSGYYVSSVSGDNYIGWHVNRGWEQNPEFFRAIQFERILYRPDLVRSFLLSAGSEDIATLAQDAQAFDIANLDRIAPPALQIDARTAPASPSSDAAATVTVTAQSRTLPMREWSAFVNGIPITPAEQRALTANEAFSFKRVITVPLYQRESRLRIESFNGQALGIAETDLVTAQPQRASTGRLLIAAIGVSSFDDTRMPALKFAANDAAEVVRMFETLAARGGFTSAKTWVREDSGTRATGASLADLPKFLEGAGGDDMVILFLASHGISDSRGNYYFVPADGRRADVDKALQGSQDVPSLMRWDFFVNALSRAAGRRLLIVDTCSSAAMGAGFDVHSLAKRSMSSSFALLAAARGNEESQEYPAARQGLFTYGLLDALRTGFDPNGDRTVSLSEAFEYAFDKVQTLRNRAVGPQTPQLVAPDALAQMPLAAVGGERTAARRPGELH